MRYTAEDYVNEIIFGAFRYATITVDGGKADYVMVADTDEGYVEELDTSVYQRGQSVIPTRRRYGTVDIRFDERKNVAPV